MDAARIRPRWRRIVAVLALLLGGFVIFLAFGLGITDSDGLAVGGVAVFAALLVAGGGLVVWGAGRLRT